MAETSVFGPRAADSGGSGATALAQGWRTVGHGPARRLLQRSLDAGRLSHAYLFTGPAQVGKRRLALDLARAVNCQPQPDMFGETPARPCGRCQPCSRIERGVHSDVAVIDLHTPIRGVADARASSEDEDRRRTVITIGHVRELQHDAALNPFEGGWRVFIIDGADQMSNEAPDALLKTLEEPPDHVLMVLLAPAARSLSETIISRCQTVELHSVSAEEIEAGLVEVGGADPEHAGILARLAHGRPGWAFNALADETALDRYRQGVLRVLGVITGDIEERFHYARDLASEFQRDRASVTRELELWRALWRDVLLTAHGVSDGIVHAGWEEALSAVSSAVTVDGVRVAIQAVEKADRALARNALPRLVLDVMMLDMPFVSPAALPESALGGSEPASDWDDGEAAATGGSDDEQDG